MRDYYRLPDVYEASNKAIAAGVEAAYADAPASAIRVHADGYAAAGYFVIANYLRELARARDAEG